MFQERISWSSHTAYCITQSSPYRVLHLQLWSHIRTPMAILKLCRLFPIWVLNELDPTTILAFPEGLLSESDRIVLTPHKVFFWCSFKTKLNNVNHLWYISLLHMHMISSKLQYWVLLQTLFCFLQQAKLHYEHFLFCPYIAGSNPMPKGLGCMATDFIHDFPLEGRCVCSLFFLNTVVNLNCLCQISQVRNVQKEIITKGFPNFFDKRI